MNLNQLHYFYDASKEENLTKVAEKYHVPVSSVSASIKRLEDDLGTKLFDRGKNKIALNSSGRLLANELYFMFERLDNAVKNIRSNKIYQSVRIMVADNKIKIADLVSDFIIEYNKKHGEHVYFTVSHDFRFERPSVYEVVIDEENSIHEGKKSFVISTEPIYVYAPKNHPLVGKEISFADLENEYFILPNIDYSLRRIYIDNCSTHKISPNVIIECNDPGCILRYVSKNVGLTFGTNTMLKEYGCENIVSLNITDFQETRSLCAFYNPEFNSECFTEFLLYLRRHISVAN